MKKFIETPAFARSGVDLDGKDFACEERVKNEKRYFDFSAERDRRPFARRRFAGVARLQRRQFNGRRDGRSAFFSDDDRP